MHYHGDACNTVFTVNIGACATFNANRFSKSYDNNQKINTEEQMFLPESVCILRMKTLQTDLW